eukprot:1183690-Prorocentrum_minimum.AAC.1
MRRVGARAPPIGRYNCPITSCLTCLYTTCGCFLRVAAAPLYFFLRGLTWASASSEVRPMGYCRPWAPALGSVPWLLYPLAPPDRRLRTVPSAVKRSPLIIAPSRLTQSSHSAHTCKG